MQTAPPEALEEVQQTSSDTSAAEEPAGETAGAPEAPAEADTTKPDAEEGAAVTESSDTVVKIATDKGDIVCRIFDEKAPITAGNFLLLVDKGFYDGLTFHRVDPGFVIQGGDPEGNGLGGPGFSIPLEVSEDLKHDRGVLSMARATNPDSAGSQFFICLGDAQRVGFLDMQYAVFGKVIEGMDVVDRIAIGDRMTKVSIESESPYADAARAKAEKARIR
ncbi:MAG: peptidylprolyl isomerase [Armatimonadetes bacterium]|nr:peptidylprolyl isomerase [Armatimonadota bacterium]